MRNEPFSILAGAVLLAIPLVATPPAEAVPPCIVTCSCTARCTTACYVPIGGPSPVMNCGDFELCADHPNCTGLSSLSATTAIAVTSCDDGATVTSVPEHVDAEGEIAPEQGDTGNAESTTDRP